MPKSRLALIVSSLLCALPLHAETDAGASYNLLIKAGINADWFLISRSNLASRNDFEDHFFGYTGAGLGYQLTDAWSLRAGYRHAWIRPQGEWLEEDRGYLEGYYADSLDGWRLTNRARIEFRFFDYRDDDIRLRNEVTLEAPWRWTSLGLAPYLEEELFYGTDAGHIEMNWLGGGLAWRPAAGSKLKLGYRWNRFRVGDRWRDRNVLVLGLNLFF